MSPAFQPGFFGTERFPRVSGDEPAAVGTSEGTITFSPRERG